MYERYRKRFGMVRTNGFTVRFGVGDPNGLQSGVWRIWADSGKSDVYVAIRTIAGISKISLHSTGECNVSLTKQEIAKRPEIVNSLGGTRHLDQWNRPLHTGSLLSIPLRIRFLESELRARLVEKPEHEETMWLPAPPSDHALDVVCIFTSQSFEPNDWPWRNNEGVLVKSAELQNGETIWVVARVYRAPAELQSLIEQQRDRAGMPANSRLLIGETGPGGVRILTDAAAESLNER